MSKVSDLIADKLQLDDPPAKVKLGKMVLDVRKRRAGEMVNTPISSHIGNTRVIGKLDVPASTCVLSKVPLRYLSSIDYVSEKKLVATLFACWAGFMVPQAFHQERYYHQTVFVLFLANDRCLRDYALVVAQCWSLF